MQVISLIKISKTKIVIEENINGKKLRNHENMGHLDNRPTDGKGTANVCTVSRSLDGRRL